MNTSPISRLLTSIFGLFLLLQPALAQEVSLPVRLASPLIPTLNLITAPSGGKLQAGSTVSMLSSGVK